MSLSPRSILQQRWRKTRLGVELSIPTTNTTNNNSFSQHPRQRTAGSARKISKQNIRVIQTRKSVSSPIHIEPPAWLDLESAERQQQNGTTQQHPISNSKSNSNQQVVASNQHRQQSRVDVFSEFEEEEQKRRTTQQQQQQQQSSSMQRESWLTSIRTREEEASSTVLGQTVPQTTTKTTTMKRRRPKIGTPLIQISLSTDLGTSTTPVFEETKDETELT